jgi:predicted transglutaminase-like cysteine proteinase
MTHPRNKLQSDFHSGFDDAAWWRKSVLKWVKAGGITLAAYLALLAVSGYFQVGVAGGPPLGYYKWCASSGECERVEPVTIAYTGEIQNLLNQAWSERRYQVAYEPEETGDDWHYPEDGRGDCEDIAIWFRTYLEAHGIPRGAMRFAVGDSAAGRHAWLTIHTSRGLVAIDQEEVALASEFHAVADLYETNKCNVFCEWRSNVIYPSRESVVVHTEDRR